MCSKLYDFSQMCYLQVLRVLAGAFIECDHAGPCEGAEVYSSYGIRYVGVIWFVIHVLNLLPIRFTQRKFCCIRKVYDGAFAKIELEVEPHLI